MVFLLILFKLLFFFFLVMFFMSLLLKYNFNNFIFIFYNKFNLKFYFIKSLVVVCKKLIFIVEDVLSEMIMMEESYLKVFYLEVVSKKWVFWESSWNYWDVSSVMGMFGVYFFSLYVFFYCNWLVFCVVVGFSVIVGIGIMLFYYSNLLYWSFVLFKWLEYFFVWCGMFVF